MDKRIRSYVRYAIFAIGVFIIVSILFGGCDNFRCYPEYDPRGNYIGIKCGGKF